MSCNKPFTAACCALLLCAPVAEAQVLQQPKSGRWVVKDLHVPPNTYAAGHESTWWTAFSIGDINQDGRPEVFTDWRHNGSVLGSEEFWHVLRSGLPSKLEINRNQGWRPAYLPYKTPYLPAGGFIRSPRGPIALAALEGPEYHLPVLVDFRTGAVLKRFTPPPGMPGQERLASFYYMHSPGDVNGDGTDDLFFQAITVGSPYVYTSGMIDGASFTLVWQRDQAHSSTFIQARSYHPVGEADPDGDGSPDFICGMVINNAGTGYESVLRALRGYDGQTIWEVQIPQVYTTCTLFEDFTGDGIADLVLAGLVEPILGIDGSSGGIVWQLPMSLIEPLLPPSVGTIGYVDRFVLPVKGSPSAFRPEAIVQITKTVAGEYTGHLLRLDATTGAIRALQSLDNELLPWSSDPLIHWQRHVYYPLGDVDRDGLPEFIRDVQALSLDNPAIPGIPKHFALFGIETFEVPASTTIGEETTSVLLIPSAPHHAYRVIASTQFDPAGGFEFDGWPTHLGASPVLASSLTLPLASGMLDAKGRAQFSWSTPAQPALAGKTLHMRGVILKPGSSSRVWTLSTLGRTLLVP